MTFADNLQAAQDETLVAAVSVLTNPPAQQFVSPGRALWPHVTQDVCDQVSVWIDTPGVFPTVDGVNPTRQSSRTQSGRAVGIAVEVVRCAATSGPNGEPPSVAAREADAAQITADIAAFWVGLGAAIDTIGGACKSVAVLNVGISPPGQPQGGSVGVIAHLIVQL